METTQSETQKRIVEQLNYGRKTEKRSTWEVWSFRVVGEQQVEVTNESYGFEKEEHQYVVEVEDRGGLFVPDTCECPADQYNEGYDCKHKVALASVGGPVVLGAAMAYSSEKQAEEPELVADGGVSVEAETDNSDERPDDCDCSPTFEELPCWPCYRDGFEEPNPDATKGDE